MRHLERRFVQAYDATYTDLVRFAARRVRPSHAEDVAAEALCVAWRRCVDLPDDPDEARAWLFGITRRLLMAKQREAGRTLSVRIGDPERVPAGESGHEDAVVAAVDLAAAWRRLTAVHQEALSLTVWDGLTGAQAARVLGISSVAYRIRLSRARRTLRRLMGVSSPTPAGKPALVSKGHRS